MDRRGKTARYDGIADWYDQTFACYGDLDDPMSSVSQLADLLGPGGGLCLDIACGGALHHAGIASTGRIVVAIDLSRDQLRVAHRRTDRLARADATRLPFPDATFPTVVSTFLHSDIDDMAPVFAEVHRVLQPRGRFVYLGVHPCFWGHFVEGPGLADRIVHQGYLQTGWIETRYLPPHGLRAKVGARHATVSELLNGMLATGLQIVKVDEPPCASGHADRLAVVCLRPGV